MKKSFPVLLVFFAILAGGFWWLQTYDSGQAEVQPPATVKSDDIIGAQSADELETVSVEAAHADVEVQAGQGQAKTIAFVPAGNADASEADQEPESEFQKSVKQMVKTSLGGSVEDSINLGQLMNQCRGVPRNERQIESALQTVNEKFSARKKWGVGNGESMAFENFKAYETYMRDKYDQCKAVRGVFNNSLHKQIADMAAAGSQVARYLYAMWPPSLGNRFRAGKMPEWLEYQNLALEYTWQNIEAGDPLGLLAFGQSFNNFDGGFFTPTNPRYAQVFFLAAKKCGLKSNWLETEVSEYVVELNQDIDGIKLDRLDIRAGELQELFCQ